jgi:hypothetical protein
MDFPQIHNIYNDLAIGGYKLPLETFLKNSTCYSIFDRESCLNYQRFVEYYQDMTINGFNLPIHKLIYNPQHE